MAAKPKQETPVVVKPPTPEEIAQQSHDQICERLLKYTGRAFTLIYRPHNGFANYAVVQLEIKDGVIDKVLKLTEPAAAFEARAKMEMLGGYELEEMRRKYPPEFRHG